jgi:serine/threonine-protein kinase
LTLFFTLRLIAARDEALASRAQTQRIHRLMLNLFEGDDAAAGPANELRVVTLLDRGVREADGLASEPGLQAELRLTLGTLYHKLGRLDRAEPLIVAARDYYVRREPWHEQAVNAQLSLAGLWTDQFRLEEARRLAEEVLSSAQRRRPVNPVEIARARAAIGEALAGAAKYGEALSALESAVAELSKHEPTLALSEAIGDLANTYYYFGRIDEAEGLNRRGLELDRRLFSERHPLVGVDLFNLGNIQLDRGDYAEAHATFRQSLAINETWYGRQHQKTARSVLMVGRSMAYQGRLEDAETAYEESLRVVRTTFGDQHPRVGQVWSLWGDLEMERRAPRAAEKMYETAAAIFKRLGEHHEFYLHQQSNLAAVHIARGAHDRAEALLRVAVQGLLAVVPEQRYTAIAQTRLAEALAGQNRHVEAEGFAVAGYHSLRMRTGPRAIELIRAREVLERIYEALGQPDKARELRLP